MNESIQQLERMKINYEGVIRGWKKKFDDMPMHAMLESERTFLAVAWVHESTQALEMVDGAGLALTIERMERLVLNNASNVPRSSSTTSNLMERYRLSVQTQILALLKAEQEVTK